MGSVSSADWDTWSSGTVVDDSEGDEITVHEMSLGVADGVLNGDLDGRVTTLAER